MDVVLVNVVLIDMLIHSTTASGCLVSTNINGTLCHDFYCCSHA